jgi:hypothetical protein
LRPVLQWPTMIAIWGRKSAAVKPVILAIAENMPMAMRPVLALSLAMLWASPALSAMDNSVEVWKSATCTCCGNWVKHLEANGLLPTVHPTEPGMLAEIK